MTSNVRATNRLIAAAIAHADAVRSGQGPSRQAEFLAAVDMYRAGRDPVQAARDEFLAAYPTPDAMQAAVDRLRVEWHATVGAFPAAVTAALIAEAQASARLDGETITIGETLPDGDPCPCGPNVYPGCPVHAPGGRAADSWIRDGRLCCRHHNDGCPSGTNYFRAWHRLRVRGLTGPEDPEAKCGAHTGRGSNRCLLMAGHGDPHGHGSHDDLGDSPPPRPGGQTGGVDVTGTGAATDPNRLGGSGWR